MVASEIVHAVSEIPQGPYRFSEVALLPVVRNTGTDAPITQSTHFEAEREILPYLYGFHPPFADPTYEQLTLKSPWCTVARANKRGDWRCRLALRSVETLDEPILKTNPILFLQGARF